MQRKLRIIFLILNGFILLSAVADNKIPIIYFYEADCPDCGRIDLKVMPEIMAKYGSKIQIFKRNVDDMKNFEAMMAFETQFKIPPQEVPEFYTAFGVTWKPEKIKDELAALIEKQLKSDTPGKYAEFLKNYLKTGKTGISVVEAIQQQYGGLRSENANSNSSPIGNSDLLESSLRLPGANSKISPEVDTDLLRQGCRKLLIYEFRKAGCRSCDRLSLSLKYLKKKFPDHIVVESLNIKDTKSKILNEAFCIKYQVDEKLHLATPALFFGSKAIVGKEAFKDLKIVPLAVDALLQVDKEQTPTITEVELKAAEDAIYQRYVAISWTAVLSAGLLDGINPCAFVTIIFLLSYLALMKFSRKDIALVGMSFTLAVFLTYLLIGLGFFKFVTFIQEIPFLNDVVYYFAILFAAIIGLLNLNDYYKIKKGSLADMDLKLSNNLRQKINSAIRKYARLRHYVIGAFGLGFAISLLELACTGQVYLPTVLFIINTQGIQFRAVLLLIAYNLAFIIPLMVIFVLFWHGSTEKRISQWLNRHGAKIKLAMALLFIFLAVFLYLFK